MSATWALRTALYMAVQSVLCGDTAASAAANFNDFVEAMLAVGFALNGATGAHAVVLDAPQGQEEKGQLVLARPAQVDAWYAFEHADIARVLEETYALTGHSFIKFADALLPGVDGYYIGSRGDM